VTDSPHPSRKTVREFSAGGVVVRRMRGQWYAAAIEPNVVNADSITRSALKQRRRPAILALPKGAINRGEDPKQGAIREVLEETGVLVQFIAKLGDIKYFYVRSWGGRERVFKVVTFYLFRYMSGRLGEIQPAMRKEVRRAVWLPLEEAHEKLTYPGERQVVQLARKYVRTHPEFEPTV
jgi:8-oxo-dGTP diphosphatase